MLVLARRLNQSFMVGDDIEIVVVDIRGDQVKLGIKAPKDVSIYRKEVYDEIQKENLEAGKEPIDKQTIKNLGALLPKKKREDEET